MSDNILYKKGYMIFSFLFFLLCQLRNTIHDLLCNSIFDKLDNTEKKIQQNIKNKTKKVVVHIAKMIQFYF